MAKSKSFGRDFSYEEYLILKRHEIIGWFMNKVCQNTVYADKFEVLAEEESGEKTSLWTGWNRQDAIYKYNQLKEINEGSKKKTTIKLGDELWIGALS